MKSFYSLMLILFFVVSDSSAQLNRHIIQFKDKNGTSFSINNPSAYLSSRAIARRTRYNIPIDSTDLPITKRYLDSIRLVSNVTILNSSKWMNQVAIQTTDLNALNKIISFSFVKSITGIAAREKSLDTTINPKFKLETIGPELPKKNVINAREQIDYGQASAQINMHEGAFLHDNGFKGEGMIIAMLDAGFLSYKTNPAFDSVRMNGQVLGERDIVANAINTDIAHGHGMNAWSTIAANRPGLMVGSAPKAKFWLFRTEDVASEYPIEEQNWLVAAEFADSVGADMISSSLGYLYFDNPSFDYSYAQRNGKFSLVTRAANLSAKKGMIVMNSAGNDGTNTTDRKYVLCPADGDSVVAVGAVNVSGQIAGFSSWGPNSAGKIKPNIVSLGQGTIIANFAGNPSAGNGTSFSNPNIAGLIVCLWQAFPEFRNMDIIDVVQRSASKFNNPDERFGYGIPNFKTAHAILLKKRNLALYQKILAEQFIKAYPVPFKDDFSVLFKAKKDGTIVLKLFTVDGKLIETKTVSIVMDDFYKIQFKPIASLAPAVYLVNYDDGVNNGTLKIFRN